MSSWNYRVIKHWTNTGNPELDAASPLWFGLHEVHYDDTGKIISFTENPEIAGESVIDIVAELRLQLQAAERGRDDIRVLDEDELPKDDEGSGV